MLTTVGVLNVLLSYPSVKNKGGQIAILYDTCHHYPWAYVHHHKLHVRTAPFKHIGKSEITMLVKMFNQMMVNTTNEIVSTISVSNPSSSNSSSNKLEYTMKKAYTQPPHIVGEISSQVMRWWIGWAERPCALVTAPHLNWSHTSIMLKFWMQRIHNAKLCTLRIWLFSYLHFKNCFISIHRSNQYYWC